jgi:hypothetical protein
MARNLCPVYPLEDEVVKVLLEVIFGGYRQNADEALLQQQVLRLRVVLWMGQ